MKKFANALAAIVVVAVLLLTAVPAPSNAFALSPPIGLSTNNGNGRPNHSAIHPSCCSRVFSVRSRAYSTAPTSSSTSAESPPTGGVVSIGSYQHKTFNVTYLYKEASPGREGDRPVVLIHPVGIGLSSWFWSKVLESYEDDDNPPIYAPDLIGCGLDHGADAWRPEEGGLFFPLSWAEGVETLLNTIVVPRWKENQIMSPLSSLSQLFDSNRKNSSGGEGGGVGCIVLVQGGLAPVGIMLAARNPHLVGNLVLTSPPTYEDVTTAVPETELRRNYDFLRSPLLGGLAFALLESRGVIEFFSNLFLFEDVCDERWLNEAQGELCEQARTPVQAFNAGLLQHRSFEEELKQMSSSGQSLTVVSGTADKRASDRRGYQTELGDACTLLTIDGCNVLPWENPVGVIDLIKELLDDYQVKT